MYFTPARSTPYQINQEDISVSENEEKVVNSNESIAINLFLKDFIDVELLALVVIQYMQEAKVPLTSENAKKIWLNVLERLSDVIKEAIEHQ